MNIVALSQIPKLEQIIDVPEDNLIEVYKVCQDLERLCISERGIGISAVQVGIPWKLFLVRGDGTCPLLSKGKFGYFVNCRYEPVGEEIVVSLEGCLSLRTEDGSLRSFEVNRYAKISLSGFMVKTDGNLRLEPIQTEIRFDQQAVVFEHEIDHNFGRDKMIDAIGKEIFVW